MKSCIISQKGKLQVTKWLSMPILFSFQQRPWEWDYGTHMKSRGVWQEFSILSKDEIGGQLWVLSIENYVPWNIEKWQALLIPLQMDSLKNASEKLEETYI